MSDWKRELNILITSMESWQNNFIVVFFLPYWPQKYSAFTWLNIICLAPGLKKTNQITRQYILAHELGHIKSNHNLITLVFLISLICYLIAYINLIPWLFFLASFSMITIIILLNKYSLTLEIQADNYAIKQINKQKVLAGFLWMAVKTKQLCKRERQKRLENIIQTNEVNL